MQIITLESYQSGIPLNIPEWLANSAPLKCYHYGQEAYFQESLADAQSSGFNKNPIYKNISYMLIKPDAFPTRKAQYIPAVLKKYGFEILQAIPIQLHRHLIRELWRYELNIATLDRYHLIDELLMSGPSIFLLLKGPDHCLNTPNYLTKLKGKTVPQDREDHSIRSQIGALNGTLNFIHSPDDLIDLIREVGVLFTAYERKKIYQLENTAHLIEYEKLVEKFNQHYPYHSLCYQYFSEKQKTFIENSLIKVDKRSGNCYEQLLIQLKSNQSFNFWDLITIMNEHVEFCVPNVKRIFDFEGIYKG